MLGALLVTTVLVWIIAEYLNTEKVVLLFIFLFHLMPALAGIRISETIPVIKPQRIATMFVLFMLLRKGLLVQYYKDFFHANIFTKPIILIIFSYLFTTILSYSKGSTAFFTASFIMEYLFMAVLVFSIFSDDDKIDVLSKALCYGTIVLCVFGIIERFTEFNVFHLLGTYRTDFQLNHQIRDDEIRIMGPFTHSIPLGVYLASTMPLFFYRYKNNPPQFYFSIGLISATIYATQSRTAIICALLVVGIYLVFYDRSKISIAILLLIPFILVFNNEIFTYLREVLPFTATGTEQINSTEARFNQLEFYGEYIKNNILFGHGIVTAPELITSGGLGYTRVSHSIDNFYLLYAFYFGLVGLAVWVLLAIIVFFRTVFYTMRNRHDFILQCLLIGLIAFFISNLVVALFENHFLYWIYIGIITRKIYNELNKEKEAAQV
ncbi:MAG: O-antigen ligase family protein [Smithella sp.]|nr:O-antigen ligase family protein [Smithella sp.]